MKSLTKTLNNFNNPCTTSKQTAPCIARKIHREKEGFEKYTKDDIYQSLETRDVNHIRRKSAPELPPIPERFVSASLTRRYSIDYFSNSSSKSYLGKSRESGRSSSSSPVYDSNNNNSDKNGTGECTGFKCETFSDAECDQYKAKTMSGVHKKENKKYRPRLSSKEHSTLSKNYNIYNNNIKSSPEKPTQETLSPIGQLTRSRTFTRTTKKHSRGQKRSTKTSLNRTVSIENIDQITRSKTLDNEMFGMRRSTSTHALDTKPVSVSIIKTEENENGNIEGSSDPYSDSEFDDYILNWIKNVESAGLEPPPDPKIDYTDEPLQKDTALHIVHDS